MEERTQKGFVDRVWDFFASIKLAIVSFALIASSSVIGTLIEQNGAYQQNVEIVAKFVGHGAAPAVYRALDAAGFMDMYHSWWFNAFLFLFAMNIVICSIDRFPAIWKVVREPLKPLGEDQFKVFPVRVEFTARATREQVREAVAALRIPLAEQAEGEGVQYYGQKGQWSRLGVYVTHASIIIIMIGSLVGVFFGFSGFLNLPEGGSYPMAFSNRALTEAEYNERSQLINAFYKYEGDAERTARDFGSTPDQLLARMKRLGIEPLGFSVRNDDFEVQFYKNTDMPREYTSHLVVLDGGREVMDRWIEVNAPLRYKGFYFYQSSYGLTDPGGEFVYRMRATASTGATEEYELSKGDSFAVPGTDVTAKIIDFSPSLSFDSSGRAYTYEPERMNNPAVKLEVAEGGSIYTKWVLRRYPQSWYLASGHLIEPQDIWGTQYTGLQVRRDPGVLLVYAGCIVMVLGLFGAFFMSHRRVWVRVRPEKGGAVRVTVAASVNKNREGFQRKIEQATAVLREGGKS